MAHVTLPDGRELDVDDGDPVIDYYRGEGATIIGVAETVTFPVVFEGGERVDPPSEHAAAASEDLGVATGDPAPKRR